MDGSGNAGLNCAKGTLDTRHGRIECGWQRTTDGYTIDVVMPNATSAELQLPDGAIHTLAAGAPQLHLRQPGGSASRPADCPIGGLCQHLSYRSRRSTSPS